MDIVSDDGQSINAGLDQLQCSIKNTSVDDAVQLMTRLGAGTLMAKVDLEKALQCKPSANCAWAVPLSNGQDY